MRTGSQQEAQIYLTQMAVDKYWPWEQRKRDFAFQRAQQQNPSQLLGEHSDIPELGNLLDHNELSLATIPDPRFDEPADIFLLQSILSSSRFSRRRSRYRLPISGHWAIQIRNEVFELNRMESYIRTLTYSRGSRAEVGSMSREEYGVRGEWSITSRKIGVTRLNQEFIRYRRKSSFSHGLIVRRTGLY